MRYALLIGINSYAHNPLKGCVHDVQEVKICLEQRSPGVKVFMMTATCAENADPRQLVENPSDWPTYDNIHSTLKLIATEAKPGDLVYIHYSGHGTRIPPSEFNGNSGDVALALLAGDRGQRVNYLHGFELACLINKIVSIGCEATVVLDCCFSGGVSRHDNDDGGRSLVYDIGIDMASPRPSAGARAYMRAGRNTSLLPEWIVNPDKYNILAACGPHEVAREIELRDRTRHGALSYFLLKLLNSNGIKEGSIDDVYGQLLASFRQNFRQQSPVLFGKQSLRFFDSSMAGTLVKSIAVIGTTASRLYLNGGQAHGLSNGDVFVLVSCHRTDKSKDFQTAGSTFGRIINAKGLTSEIEVIDGPPDTKAFRAGWIAMPKNQPSLLRYRTHFQVTSTQQATWIEACSHRLSLNATFSEVADPSAAFTVIVGDTNSYEVRDANLQRSFERPRIPPGEDCLQEVVNTIEQLAWPGGPGRS
ncbi:hypothetical protein TruAng_001915 [Truncatella angustata]|nr:hypothetical protein TruAng_001915 [Truncatella angustata]